MYSVKIVFEARKRHRLQENENYRYLLCVNKIDRNSTNDRIAKVNYTRIITLHRIKWCLIERSGDTLLG